MFKQKKVLVVGEWNLSVGINLDESGVLKKTESLGGWLEMESVQKKLRFVLC